jgi:ArsR family transcriptional regulator
LIARLDQVLKAAGEPTRLRILNLLQAGGICVCDLQAVLEIPQHTVSRHLAALRHAGLVVDERNGQRVIYSLAPATAPPVKAMRRVLEECWPNEKALRDDRARLKQTLRRGQCALVKRADREENATAGTAK